MNATASTASDTTTNTSSNDHVTLPPCAVCKVKKLSSLSLSFVVFFLRVSCFPARACELRSAQTLFPVLQTWKGGMLCRLVVIFAGVFRVNGLLAEKSNQT
jgi:hypothetical protein